MNNTTITDKKRIQETIPTINLILAQQPKSLIIISHLGYILIQGDLAVPETLNTLYSRSAYVYRNYYKKM